MKDLSVSSPTKPVSILSHYPLGDSALVLKFGDNISPEVHQSIRLFTELLANNPLPGLVEWVPAYTTLTLYYNPSLLSSRGIQDPYTYLLHHLQGLAVNTPVRVQQAGRLVEIPVCYGDVWGPDLPHVAELAGMPPEEVIALHSGSEYFVHMIGFAPGFPYLGGMDARISAPRKALPNPRVPAGSVGIAGNQTGIYPLDSPGGWQIIGRTPLSLFSIEREQPSLLKAGDRLRFISIPPEAFNQPQHVT